MIGASPAAQPAPSERFKPFCKGGTSTCEICVGSCGIEEYEESLGAETAPAQKQAEKVVEVLVDAIREQRCNGCGMPRALWGPVCGGMYQGDNMHYHSAEWWRDVALADLRRFMAESAPKTADVQADAALIREATDWLVWIRDQGGLGGVSLTEEEAQRLGDTLDRLVAALPGATE